MGQKKDEQASSSIADGSGDEESRMLLQAEEDLHQAKEALRQAQEIYDALASRCRKGIRTSRRKKLQKLRSLANQDERVHPNEVNRSAIERREKLQKKAQKRYFFNSLRTEISIEQPAEGLVSLFHDIKSLDQFAKRLRITRRNAIHALKKVGFDVLESIAKEWQNGKSLRDLSEKHGPMPQTISKWIKSTGREIKPRNSNEKYDREQINRWFDAGWTTNKIAKRLGHSWATMQKCYESWWEAKQKPA